MNADMHSPASSARSTKRQVRGNASVSGSLQLPLTDREATAFMSKQRSGLRMSALLRKVFSKKKGREMKWQKK